MDTLELLNSMNKREMTLLDHFAGLAMQGLAIGTLRKFDMGDEQWIAFMSTDGQMKQISEVAYNIARAMIDERERRGIK